MSSYLGALRQARNEVIPSVPEMAPYLPTEPNIIRAALLGAIANKDIDPATIPEKDINKATRHAMIGYMMREVRQTIVEGEGSEAHFTVAVGGNPRGNTKRRGANFGAEIATVLDTGATQVTRKYSGGRDMAHSWYPGLERRYYELGQEAEQITPHREKARWPRHRTTNPIPIDGKHLYDGMRSEGLSSSVNHYAKLIRAKVEVPDARIKAAHDMTPVLLGLAGVHFYEVIAPLAAPKKLDASVSISERTHAYTLRLPASERSKLYPSIPDLPNAVLKCPVHAAVSPEQAEEQGSRDTNLAYFVHAGINLAHEQFDLFR
jgi:hypothetical protein